ncbi:unnamed protein product [Mycena citricolor]|uniref:Uncharacterized protein n=1 Tax=Mycena citricolor TaxID=2018698 RepID=A0AAD2Q4E3_9AGAR|nr:unnamed protein product [Mycena citricolor]
MKKGCAGCASRQGRGQNVYFRLCDSLAQAKHSYRAHIYHAICHANPFVKQLLVIWP